MTAASLTLADIEFRHSGGLVNTDPEADLGGAMSSFPLSALSLNNLFDDVTPDASRKEDYIDFRCFYITNTNVTDSLRNAKLWLKSDKSSIIALGIPVIDEVQNVVITSSPPGAFNNEGNSFTLEIPDYSASFTVEYDPNPTKWVGNFQTEIRAIEGFSETIVTISGTMPDVTFTVNFGGHNLRRSIGQARSRDLDLMTVMDDSLDNATIAVAGVTDGSPIYTTAVTIANKFTAPAGITFDYPLRGNPVELGSLRPTEFFPVWVRRTIPAGTLARILDNFIINVEGTYP